MAVFFMSLKFAAWSRTGAGKNPEVVRQEYVSTSIPISMPISILMGCLPGGSVSGGVNPVS